MERSPSFIVTHIHVCIVLHQKLHHVKIVVDTCLKKAIYICTCCLSKQKKGTITVEFTHHVSEQGHNLHPVQAACMKPKLTAVKL